MGEADEIWNKPRVKIMTLSSWRTESHVATFLNCFRFSLDIEKTPVYNEVTDIDWRSRPMKTEDMLKVKFVLVCAVASELESGQSVGIPLERLLHGISIINRMIGFRDDNRLETKNQAAAVKTLLRSCGIEQELTEIA